MTIQRRLLQAMLGLLALAALAGISTIFFPGGEFIGRVAGTLSFAATAIALTIPASKKLGIQSERTAGLITLLSIVIAFSLSFISLWADFVVGSLSWQLPVTTLAYIACAIPALAFLAILKTPRGRISGLTGVAFSAIVFLCCLFAIWLDYLSSNSESESFSKTTALLAAAALPICACLYGELTDRRYWRWIGVLTGAAAIFMGIIGIWFISGGKPTNIIHCLIVSTVIGGCNILLRLSLPQSQRWLAIATTCTLIATGICGIYVNYLIDLASNTIDSEFVTRLLAASAIVTVCGILAIVVLKAFSRRVVITEARSIADIKAMTVHCPRCSKIQDARLGESHCGGCGLMFLIHVAEGTLPEAQSRAFRYPVESLP